MPPPQPFSKATGADRVFLAVAELAHEAGPESLTTSRIVKRGRISRNAFYELFSDKTECLDLACEFATERFVASIRAARPDAGGWRECLAGVVDALLGAVSAEPQIAELCLVHAPVISTRGTELGSEPVVEVLVETMDGGWAVGGAGREMASGLAEFVAATIVSIVVRRVRSGEAAELPALQGELTELAARLWSEPAERVGAP